MQKNIGQYQNIQVFTQTNNAILYKAKKEKLDFILKEYIGEDKLSDAQNDMDMSQAIELDSNRSITVPTIEMLKEENKVYTVRQFRHQGIFLNVLFDELEKKYGIGKIPSSIVFGIIREILIAVKELHTCHKDGYGYVHMDIHPGNIFMENFSCDGEKVINFGHAKFIDFENAIAMTEVGVGRKLSEKMTITECYSAPELYRMGQYDVSATVDLYSVAAILLNATYGGFASQDMDLCLNYFDTNYKQGSSSLRYVLSNFFKVALSKHAENRFQSAERMLLVFEKMQEYEQAIEEKDIYKVLTLSYEMAMPLQVIMDDSYFGGTINNADLQNIQNSIQKMYEDNKDLAQSVNRYYYIYSGLQAIVDYSDITLDLLHLVRLAGIGMRANNYKGNNKESIKIYESLQKQIKDEKMQNLLITKEVHNEIVELLSVVTSSYVERFCYKEAIDAARKAVFALEKEKDFYQEISRELEINGVYSNISLGKAYGAYGAYCNLTNEHPEEQVRYLELSINEFKDKGQRSFSISRLMNYYVEVGDRESFEKWAPAFYGEEETETNIQGMKASLVTVDTLTNRLDYCCGKLPNTKLNTYGLLGVLRSVHTFYMDVCTDDFVIHMLETLKEFVESVTVDVHARPYNWIFKYAAKIVYRFIGNQINEDVDALMNMSLSCIEGARINPHAELNALMVSNYCTLWEYNKMKQNAEEDEDKKNEIESENQAIYQTLIEHAKACEWKELVTLLEERENLDKFMFYEKR